MHCKLCHGGSEDSRTGWRTLWSNYYQPHDHPSMHDQGSVRSQIDPVIAVLRTCKRQDHLISTVTLTEKFAFVETASASLRAILTQHAVAARSIPFIVRIQMHRNVVDTSLVYNAKLNPSISRFSDIVQFAMGKHQLRVRYLNDASILHLSEPDGYLQTMPFHCTPEGIIPEYESFRGPAYDSDGCHTIFSVILRGR